MLLENAVPRTPPVGTATLLLENDEIGWGSPEDKTALKIVVQDVAKAENFINARDLRAEWDYYERLFAFHVPQQYWDNGVPRASLGIPLVLEHIESIEPQVMIGLFQNLDKPFSSEPRPGTKLEDARANDALLSWELSECNFREELRLGLRGCLQYGLGVWKYGWIRKTVQQTTFTTGAKKFRPLDIGGVEEPPDDDKFESQTVDVEVNHPTFEHCDIRHILFDPGLTVPNLRKAKWVAHILYVTAEQLDSLREMEGYNIPTREQLTAIFSRPKEDALPNSLEGSQINIHKDFKAEDRALDTTIDPLRQPLQLIEYWTPTRIITVLQKKLVIRNTQNDFGEVPFFSMACVDVLNSGYGFGIAKLIGNEQRLQQGVINGFLDDFSLALNGMFVVRRGANVMPADLRMRPGGVIKADTTANDNLSNSVSLMARQQLPLQETMAVLAASDARAQRRTAASELAVQGSVPGEKSSITRSATGASIFASATGTRLQGNLIEKIADQVFVPTLEAFHKMNARRLRPSQIDAILNDELGKGYNSSASGAVNSKVKFSILAAAKLQSKRAMASSLPIIINLAMQEPVIQSLQMQGQKINFAKIFKTVCDVSGYPAESFIDEMTEDDQVRSLLSNPGVQQMMAKNAELQQQHSNDLDSIEQKGVARAGTDVIKAALAAHPEMQPPQPEGANGTGQGSSAA